MRHLLSHTVYGGTEVFGDDPYGFLGGIGADGLELLTSYEAPDPWYRGIAESVHLPYATDWMAAWESRPYDLDDELSLYYTLGRSREDVVANVRRAIDAASDIAPAYGVFHASNGSLEELCLRRYTVDSRKVLSEFSEMMNSVVSGFPGGEPPYRILFENLWWPGLRMTDESDFRYLSNRIEFENWGICLDTGHLMNCLPVTTEAEGIDALLDIFYGYSRDLIDSIRTVHFHWSASGSYRESFEEWRPDGDLAGFIASAYPHITEIDRHLPFTDPRCAELLDVLEPDYVTHEMPETRPGYLDDFRNQRSLLDRM